MHFSFDKTEPRITYEDHGPFGCNLLIIEFEFGESMQEDGHEPADGDMRKAYADAVVNSIPRKAIADVLEQNGVKAMSIQGHGVTVKPSDKKGQWGFPLKTIQVRFSIVPKENIYLAAAEQLIGSVNPKVTKAAINSIGHYFWDYG